MTRPLQCLHDVGQHQFNRTVQCTLETDHIEHVCMQCLGAVEAFFRIMCAMYIYMYTPSTQDPKVGLNWAEML